MMNNPIFSLFSREFSSSFSLSDKEHSLEGAALKSTIIQFMSYLQNNGVQHNSRVAVLTGKTIGSPLSMIALWGVGAVYVPVSHNNPPDRMEYILSNCEIDTVILNHPKDADKFTLGNRKLLFISDILSLSSQNSIPTESPATPDDMAYILYTSGTTGMPKGVVIQHSAVQRLYQTCQESFLELSQDDRMLQVVDFSFDVSVWDILLWISKRCSMHIIDMGQNVFQLITAIKEKKATYLCNASPTYSLMMNTHPMWEKDQFDFVKSIITTASYCPPKVAAWILKTFKNAKLYNCYGPTETTVYCNWVEIKSADIALDRPLSIGHVMPGLSAYLYDGEIVKPANQIAENVEQELCISGPHLFKEYWKSPDLTESKMLYLDGERIYRTGDLVTRQGNQFYYFGRADDTIKVHGYRVNLGEIEHAISALDFVGTTAVIAIEDANQQTSLIAFFNKKDGTQLSGDEMNLRIKEQCQKKLAPYMVPKKIIYQDVFPVSNAGKLDRKKLKASVQ